MKILITGGRGMLARSLIRRFELCRERTAESEPKRDREVVALGRAELDITSPEAVRACMRAQLPDVVIHAAAMTKVDLCESEPDAAFGANALGAALVAASAHDVGARFIGISTDYVFSGALDRPYHEWDEPGPRTIYGMSKLGGERAIEKHAPNHVILRVAWLYGAGGPSFVHTMLALGAKDGPPLRVVNDQIGNPTSTDAVAEAVDLLLERPVVGIFHLTCEGEATWYEFTKEIFRLKGLSRGVEPCTTEEFPRPAPRPKNSRLENRALRLIGAPPMPEWGAALETFFKEHPNG